MSPIVTGAPLWVWPLLALLIGMGLMSLTARRVPVWTLAILPALSLGLAAMRIAKMPSVATGAVVFLVCGALFLWSGVKIARSIEAAFDRAAGRLTLPGSPFTLVFGLSVFSINYAFGVLFGFRPDLAADPVIALAPAMIGGVLSGFVLGRQGRLFLRYRRNDKT